MKPHSPGKWYRTHPETVERGTPGERTDCGIVVAGPNGQPNIIAECFGRTNPFIKNDAIANADRIVMCVNALDGFINPKETVEMMQQMMDRCEIVSKAFVEVLDLLPESQRKPEWLKLKELQTT